MQPVLGVIGGSGIYDLPGLTKVSETRISTPFGDPSDRIVRGRLGDVELVFLPRHNRSHSIAPHRINYRANIAALKLSGVTHLLSLSAVGSLKEELAPGEVVLVDQYVDLTRQRTNTFFDQGVVAHVAFGEPSCPEMRKLAHRAATKAGAPKVHVGGSLVVIDGPQFSTRAESFLYRKWDMSVIGMTALPEAKLAREAELPYATFAMVTDYDCWHDDHDQVSVDAVVAVLRANAEMAKQTVAEMAKLIVDVGPSSAQNALANALLTPADKIDPKDRQRLGFLINKYLEPNS